MRVCQFRHYGTVFYAPHRWPEHANREPLVLQTTTALSMRWKRCELLRVERLLAFGGMENREPATQCERLMLKNSVYLCRNFTFPK